MLLSVQASSDEEAVRRTEGERILSELVKADGFELFSPSVFCFAKSTSLIRGRLFCAVKTVILRNCKVIVTILKE